MPLAKLVVSKSRERRYALRSLYTLDFEDYYSNRTKDRIFLQSKQISTEALDNLYGDNIFELNINGEGEYHLKKNFTDSNRRKMRYLLVIARSVARLEILPDNALWSSILPNLKALRIEFAQPVQASSYCGAPTLKQEVDC